MLIIFFFDSMRSFTIVSNAYLSQDTPAYFHSDYRGGGNYKIRGTIEHAIFTLKGERFGVADRDYADATDEIERILVEDIRLIAQAHNDKRFTVCVIPRSKVLPIHSVKRVFQRVIRRAVQQIEMVADGVYYITRIKDTYTTHKSSFDGGGNGPKPYPGITLDTCTIADDVAGRDILLIDDIYTRTVNIDEDAIQALLNRGAKSVVFYSIGCTISRF